MVSLQLVCIISRVLGFLASIVVIGLMARVDVAYGDAYVRYGIAAGAVGTAFLGLFGIPFEFLPVPGKRWILMVLDNISWMALIASAIISAYDIHTVARKENADDMNLSYLGPDNNVALFQGGCAFGFVGFFFALICASCDMHMLRTEDHSFKARPKGEASAV